GNVQIREIASMALTREYAVLVRVRIEVRPRRFERRLAFADRMEVHGVLTGLHPLEHELDQEPAGRLHQIGAADECPVLVLELRVADHRRLSIRRQREAGEQQTCADKLHLRKMSHVLTSQGYTGAAGVARRVPRPGRARLWEARFLASRDFMTRFRRADVRPAGAHRAAGRAPGGCRW